MEDSASPEVESSLALSARERLTLITEAKTSSGVPPLNVSDMVLPPAIAVDWMVIPDVLTD